MGAEVRPRTPKARSRRARKPREMSEAKQTYGPSGDPAEGGQHHVNTRSSDPSFERGNS